MELAPCPDLRVCPCSGGSRRWNSSTSLSVQGPPLRLWPFPAPPWFSGHLWSLLSAAEGQVLCSHSTRTMCCSEKPLACHEWKRKEAFVAWTLFSAGMRCVLRGTGLRAGLLLQTVSPGGTWTVTSSGAAGVCSVGCGHWRVAGGFVPGQPQRAPLLLGHCGDGCASCGSQRGGKWRETPRWRQMGRARGRRVRGWCTLSLGLGRPECLRGHGRRGGWKEKDPVWEGRPAPPLETQGVLRTQAGRGGSPGGEPHGAGAGAPGGGGNSRLKAY